MQEADGSKRTRTKGTPQGGPLSPLLANIYLDPLDKELEKRGVAFVRYADDIAIFASSERADTPSHSQMLLAAMAQPERTPRGVAAIGNQRTSNGAGIHRPRCMEDGRAPHRSASTQKRHS